ASFYRGFNEPVTPDVYVARTLETEETVNEFPIAFRPIWEANQGRFIFSGDRVSSDEIKLLGLESEQEREMLIDLVRKQLDSTLVIRHSTRPDIGYLGAVTLFNQPRNRVVDLGNIVLDECRIQIAVFEGPPSNATLRLEPTEVRLSLKRAQPEIGIFRGSVEKTVITENGRATIYANKFRFLRFDNQGEMTEELASPPTSFIVSVPRLPGFKPLFAMLNWNGPPDDMQPQGGYRDLSFPTRVLRHGDQIQLDLFLQPVERDSRSQMVLHFETPTDRPTYAFFTPEDESGITLLNCLDSRPTPLRYDRPGLLVAGYQEAGVLYEASISIDPGLGLTELVLDSFQRIEDCLEIRVVKASLPQAGIVVERARGMVPIPPEIKTAENGIVRIPASGATGIFVDGNYVEIPASTVNSRLITDIEIPR
ncbi:MAG: hypothetical protein KDD44_05765, partial [Bdellovibrionales bacterium]|nr:hypothetical protein [Bdellovibrionales bacterium]